MGKKLSVFISVVGLIGLLQACQRVDVASGSQLFQENCANCHGVYAEGDGPASVDIGLPIPDLRYLTESNAGVFPERMVYEIIDGRTDIEAHYPRRMPIWGYEFSLQESDDEAARKRVEAKLRALTNYLKSIQQAAK